MPIYANCKTCGEVFAQKPSRTLSGRGLYCSKACNYRKKDFPEDRFWSKVEKTESCWNWTAGNNRGYGQFSIGGRANGGNILAHRFSYELVHGKLPPGVCVLHRCDNPSCVNPDHLFTGTQQDNIADKMGKNRQAKGGAIACSKLTEDQVMEIRRRFGFGRQVLASMAKEFEVSEPTIARIRDEVTWKHILQRQVS